MMCPCGGHTLEQSVTFDGSYSNAIELYAQKMLRQAKPQQLRLQT